MREQAPGSAASNDNVEDGIEDLAQRVDLRASGDAIPMMLRRDRWHPVYGLVRVNAIDRRCKRGLAQVPQTVLFKTQSAYWDQRQYKRL